MKNFKLILKSLISNAHVVEGGRHRPWYFAVPMYVIAMILALIPIFVQTITRQGDAIFATNTYTMEISSLRFLEEIKDKGVDMTVQNGELVVDETKWNETFTTVDPSNNNCYIHYHKDALTLEERPDLGVYYLPSVKLTDDVYKSITSFPSTSDSSVRVNRTYSFILFTEKTVTIYVYSTERTSGSTKGASIGTIYGDYQSFENGYKISDILGEDADATWTNFKSFTRKAYDNSRLRLTWQTTLLMFGINAFIVIFMGFMIWVLTRGKNNPFRVYTIWESLKIAAWASISPAILTTGLGFLISQFAQVLFPLLLGVRIMWLSMKTLRPEYAPQPEPTNKKVKTVDAKPAKK